MEQEGATINGAGKKELDRSGELHSLPEVPRVDVHIVTWGSSATIVRCIESVLAQRGFRRGSNLFVRVSDNASQDGTADLIDSHFGDQVILVRHVVNLGFCAGQNAGISAAIADGASYVMLLNPDVRLEPDALLHLVSALEEDQSAGWATPRLYRADQQLNPVEPLRIDTAGVFITPAIRHFDRASEQLDRGEYDRREYVFGASGAAALLRASFVTDAALPDRSSALQLFDERFFAYREDADLGWRAQWLGWSCLYVPEAQGYHVRHVLPERRKQLAPELNAYGVRNRFLLQLNNLSVPLAVLLGGEWIIRNLLVIAGAIVSEPLSRRALGQLLRRLPAAIRMRQIVFSKRRSSPIEVARWFRRAPYTEPALTEDPSLQQVRSITAVIVSYNAGPRVATILESLKIEQAESARHGVALAIAVVENGDPATLPNGIGSESGISLHVPGSNLGFGPAINYAAHRHPADALLILNPDLVLTPGTVRELALQLDRFSALGAVAPVLVNHDGTPQCGFTARRFPTSGSVLAELFGLHRLFPRNPWTARYLMSGHPVLARYLEGMTGGRGPRYPQDRPFVVDQPAGACLLVRSTAFAQLGGFDEQFAPAWYEDVDLLLRLRRAGHLAALLGAVRVRHEGGYSLSVIRKARYYEIFYPNLVRYFAVHRSKNEQLLLRVLLPIALIVRAGIAGAASLLAEAERSTEHAASARALFQLATGGARRKH